MSRAAADALIREAAFGVRAFSDDELDLVLDHIAATGFDPIARERVRGQLAGVRWRGVLLRGSDRLPPAERRFLKHVVLRREWPRGTDLQGYLRSLREDVEDPTSGIFTSRYQGEPQFGVVRMAGNLRRPDGFDWVLVEYRVATGYWITGYQPRGGLGDLRSSMRSDLRWWREPELING